MNSSIKLPDYLQNITFNKFRAPATSLETDLPFELLEPRIFERLCCDLVHKRLNLTLTDEVIDILPIGESGQKQYGADIFLKNNENGKGEVTLYEVKRVKSYTLSDYKKAVSRFLNNYDNWGFDITQFNLFVADNISAESIALWQREAMKLSKKNISYRVIPSSTLNKWIRRFPELVYKYFHPAWTEMLFGESAIWHLEKYGIWSYEEPACWVNYTTPKKTLYHDTLTYINDHVKIHAYLPTIEKNSASCFIEFRNGRFSHVLLTLNHKQLVNNFFVAANFPINETSRPFLTKRIDSDDYYCDIGNCRISLTLHEAESFCEALDVCSEEYCQNVENIEDTWRSKNFNYHINSTENIPMLKVNRSLWSLLLDFSRYHDAFNTTGPWSIFDSCPGWLKVYTKHASKNMDAGYHVFITPMGDDNSFSNFRKSDDDVILTWQPPNDRALSTDNAIINPRRYWDIETTHNWIRFELIPRALEWEKEIRKKPLKERVKSIVLRSNGQFPNYDPQKYSKSLFTESPSSKINTSGSVKSLLFVVNELQSFFNRHVNSAYIDHDSYKNLFHVLSEVLSKSDSNDFSYLHGNLSYLEASDMSSLIRSIREHPYGEKSGCGNSFRIDCVLRCIQVSLRDYKSHLNNYEIRGLINDLTPLIKIVERRMLLIRQTRFFNQ
ncbi:hypothetical protein [Reinekea marinisedimentorum]|uniref:Uncharacterized protein n=1 Tax=Reinekea marinisedimentorum TaxID=230495 RepID=A0A4V2UIZ6_9GAMM|nr:hypothetical protein [Reinekea marinisedimentorum]TCS38080.1 hypothetical protein BCF53_1175 [Reinekea marinisedimentorum]